MGSKFPYVYPHSRGEAHQLGQTQMHEASFRLNVTCARAIEQAVRDHFDETAETLAGGCAESVLERFGFKRVNFVLANSLKELQKTPCNYLISDEIYRWGRETEVPEDGRYNRYYVVDTAAKLLESFIRQTWDVYQALELDSAPAPGSMTMG